MSMQPIQCGNCKEDLPKDKIVFNHCDKTGADAMCYCEHCKNNNHFSFGPAYIYTWEYEGDE